MRVAAIVVAVAVALLTVPTTTQAQKPDVAGVRRIERTDGAANSGFAEDPPATMALGSYRVLLPEVVFEHKIHKDQKVQCATCHHLAKDGKAAPKCGACHLKAATGKVLSVKDAFHDSCVKCHQMAIKANATSKAPVKCNECHLK